MKLFTIRFSLILFAVNLVLLLSAQESKQVALQYKSPVPGAKYTTVSHSIAIRQGEVFDVNSMSGDILQVIGSKSGVIDGMVKLSADSKTLIFTPDNSYQYNEEISITLNSGLKTASGFSVKPESWSFWTMKEDNTYLRERIIKYFNEQYVSEATAGFSPEQPKTGGIKSIMDLPDDYPNYEVTVHNNPGPGYWFVTPHNLFAPLNHPAYSIIMDDYGTPVYYLRNNSHALNLKIQETGDISQFLPSSAGGLGIAFGTYYTYDNSMNPLDTFQMGNGYEAEEHDFVLTNDGSYLLFTYDAQIVDMSAIVDGGDPAATVMGCVLQELDADDNVVLEWSSWDHMEITEATPDVVLTAVFIDYCHANAVDKDDDGNILVSFRNTDDIIKINNTTGEIIWRMNTNREDLNDITFINDTIQFSHQHDIRRQDDGTITMFDNGNLHYGPYTRLVKYEIDETNKTAELVWVYPPEYKEGVHFAFATGDAHWQPNGHVAAGWGLVFPIVPSQLIFGEVAPDYQTTLQVIGYDSVTTYRAHKFQWETDLFDLSKDTINWGEFTGYTPAPYIIQVTNNSDEAITISGTHNHQPQFYAATGFPLEISAGATENIIINFFPSTDGYFQDVMTIMCQKNENEMMGKQVVLKGYTEDIAAPEVTIEPADGSTEVILMPKMKISLDEKAYTSGGTMLTNNDLADIIEFKKGSATGEDIPFDAEIIWIDNTITDIKITPQDVLDEMTDYYLALKENTVQDWAGNVISGNNSVVFTTGDQLGVDEAGNELKAIVYPNPGKGFFKVAFAENTNKNLVVYDMKGNTVLENKALSGLETTLDLTHLPAGIYFIRVIQTDTNETFEMKVLKQ
ncbi:MAG TPA: aryl-sulfate sulfotransferase [Bacteroidales bacterium]|nr:aryl-sulfate sulfotransferase [Bacteroidales bacterium]HRX98401.1 aryl-sulfate sulfotransferase [Bacteroidales bacterium]